MIRSTRHYFAASSAGLALWFAVSGAAWGQPASGHWIDAGAYGEFHVVVPDDANDELRSAAAFFKEVWEEATQREITEGPDNDGKINVWLGRPAVASGLLRQDVVDDLGDDGLLVHTYRPGRRFANQGAERQLIFAGGRDEALHFAIAAFFEQRLGVRFLTPEVRIVPGARFTMNPMEYRFRTPFAYRDTAYHGLWDDGPRRAQRLALKFPAQWRPGPYPLYNLYDLLPPEDHGDLYHEVEAAAPDCWHYGALAAATGGRRLDVCLGDPAVAEALVESLAELLAADPAALEGAAARRYGRIVSPGETQVLSIVPMPWSGGGCGNDSTALSALLATAGDSLRDRLPDTPFRFHVLAEGAYRAAPAVSPPPGTIVQVSAREVDAGEDIRSANAPENAAFRDDLEAWAALDVELHVLEYAASCRHPLQLHPNFAYLDTRLQYYDQVGARGVYAFALPGVAAPVGEWDGLRAYVVSKLLWDPDYPAMSAVDDFLDGYYGPARSALERFMALGNDARARSNAVLTAPAAPWWDRQWLEESETLFDETLGGDLGEPYRGRVKRARLPVDYARYLHDLASGEDEAAAAERFASRLHEAVPGLGAADTEALTARPPGTADD